MAHSRQQSRPDMIRASHQMVLVRNIEIPQHTMKKLGAVVKIEQILVAGFDVDREAASADRVGVGDRQVSRIVGREDRAVTIRTDANLSGVLNAILKLPWPPIDVPVMIVEPRSPPTL